MSRTIVRTTTILNGEPVTITTERYQGRETVIASNEAGDCLFRAYANPNGFHLLGSVRSWLGFRKATRNQRLAEARAQVASGNEGEARAAQMALDADGWGKWFEANVMDKSLDSDGTPVLGWWA